MSTKKLTREEVQQKRDGLRSECEAYVPTRGGYKCQHYAGKGACSRPDFFMCVVWVRKHPEEAYHLEDQKKPPPEPEKKAEPTLRRRGSTKDEYRAQPEESRKPVHKPSTNIYDLTSYGVQKQEEDRHLLAQPELLTEQAVESLSQLGIEVTVKAANGTEVTLVPQLTGKERCELTFEHARALVMMLQVFPGATVEQIEKPDEEKAV